ncbi:MAG: hypothetical protein JXR25_05910 [Pontiellaceae bacterium]|nr:hypothetical protein [Pontiellaceae bacterium]MBN2784343.1 hypothetical protein [Pontiellaceae bacterium]
MALLLSCSLLSSTFAGTLSNFEDAVAKPSKDKDRSHDSGRLYYHDDYDDSDSLSDSCLTLGFETLLVSSFYGVKWLVYDWWAAPDEEELAALAATEGSVLVVEAEDGFPEESSADPDDFGTAFVHRLGTPAMSYLRADYRWQYLDHDLDANDFLLEAGYKYFAVYGRVTQYEGAADEHLDIEQYYGMVRFGGSDAFYFPGSFQVGAGLGGYVIEGDREQSGGAFTLPIMFYPNDWFGMEFRPAWTYINEKSISDYDLSLSLGREFTHLRLGYRWLWVQHEGHWLNGPYAGISVSF